MPLSEFQQHIARLLSDNRSLDSHVAGGSAIARETIRRTRDIDIFHDAEALVREASERDTKTLAAAGYSLEWIRDFPSIRSAKVLGGPEPLKLEWAHDSAWRFYPAEQDPDFGYLLHPADLATNKVIAAASRREPRDLFDLCALAADIPIPAAIIAASGKDPGLTPDVVVDLISRFSRYQQADFDAVPASRPVDAARILGQVREALQKTSTITANLPPSAIGKLYLDGGIIKTPDPAKLASYTVREASRAGVAATISDIPVEVMRNLYQKGQYGR